MECMKSAKEINSRNFLSVNEFYVRLYGSYNDVYAIHWLICSKCALSVAQVWRESMYKVVYEA